MKAIQELVCDIAPGCRYKVGIRIYPTEKALTKAFRGEDSGQGDAEAFCSCDTEIKDERIATLHFWIGAMSPDIVVHEAFHAIAEMIKVCRLNIDDEDGQELAAYGMSQLTEKALHAKKLYERNSRH